MRCVPQFIAETAQAQRSEASIQVATVLHVHIGVAETEATEDGSGDHVQCQVVRSPELTVGRLAGADRLHVQIPA